ncbi:MarR family transcriptional regulator [Streptomyces sp. WMMC940]|uniref:MarR family transcriptional regulator n=1 Tax=Streptomyces sp. WMMC940 TaxID=3015153 RepID=UPI0022B70D20|nr:helix-turn-helix domain-containing protein [Streptomyces sp. WMMC940]MCZ7458268.1 helix-turn-helix domain-containing protein [Streptomyces sp. WMMC940]
MSNAATDNTQTMHAVPVPKLPAGLTGAPAAVYAELVNLTGDDKATAVELARAAGLGRSTTGKALTILEQQGLAQRTLGGHDGPRRTPDRWRAASSPASSDHPKCAPEHANAKSEPSTVSTPQPDTPHAEGEDIPATDTAPDSEEETDAATAPAANTPPQAPERAESNATAEADPEHNNGGGWDSGDTLDPQSEPEPHPTVSPALIAQPGMRKRLAPGALRQMVVDHLEAHPDEAFTATRISRLIEKSSGAIANALDKLVKEGIAEQVDDRPRTFRLANG